MPGSRGWVAAALAAAGGLGYWAMVSAASGGVEPWDAPVFWTMAFPGALALSAALGAIAPSRAWLWGAIVMLAQVPVVVSVAGASALMIAGLLYASVLAVPAALVAWGSGALRQRLARHAR
ncbi:hypothetical protein [Luteimonas chenhongjianii]|nr:hypothetical protein [Luteimonas chenhongjianii]